MNKLPKAQAIMRTCGLRPGKNYASRWISVNDGLPPVGQKVLGLSKGRPIYHGCYFITEHIGDGIWRFDLPITQWMPLPKPPISAERKGT